MVWYGSRLTPLKVFKLWILKSFLLLLNAPVYKGTRSLQRKSVEGGKVVGRCHEVTCESSWAASSTGRYSRSAHRRHTGHT